MNDTSPKVEALVQELLMQRSGWERMLMGFDMYETARAIVEGSLEAEGLIRGSVEFRRRLLQRLYGDELSPEVIEKIAVARSIP